MSFKKIQKKSEETQKKRYVEPETRKFLTSNVVSGSFLGCGYYQRRTTTYSYYH